MFNLVVKLTQILLEIASLFLELYNLCIAKRYITNDILFLKIF